MALHQPYTWNHNHEEFKIKIQYKMLRFSFPDSEGAELRFQRLKTMGKATITGCQKVTNGNYKGYSRQ